MTYNVFSGTLNPAQSVNLVRPSGQSICRVNLRYHTVAERLASN